jgi:hypothetical protein
MLTARRLEQLMLLHFSVSTDAWIMIHDPSSGAFAHVVQMCTFTHRTDIAHDFQPIDWINQSSFENEEGNEERGLLQTTTYRNQTFSFLWSRPFIIHYFPLIKSPWKLSK